jgi:hypothetical protein
MQFQTAKQILAAYSWLVIGALLFFLWRIARFYERASGQRVAHWLLAIPGALLASGVMLYVRHDADFVGLPSADLLLFAGGIMVLIFCSRLQKLMTGE